ncbi:MAG: hypothetical protein LBK95_04860 [Bifidobacteriaceae bacterium]|jgi:hypothetical protein|nr:hypothetical protein [Bifidobacteriaceae bacterium]
MLGLSLVALHFKTDRLGDVADATESARKAEFQGAGPVPPKPARPTIGM